MKIFLLKLLASVTKGGKALVALLLPIFQTNMAELIGELAPIATTILLSLADSKMTGEEKRSSAFTQIEAAAVQQGIKAGASAINTAIELTLSSLKAQGQVQ